jgi:flagellar biosynthesis/type III secretory pathway M-ring protein FliF/YscJ
MENKEIKNQSSHDKTSPDELMESFRGRSLKSIILFTIVIHAVLLLGTSVSFLMKAVTGKDTSELSEQERMELAMKEATDSLREIAEEHGLNVQDISNNFADGSSKASTKPEPKTPDSPESENGAGEPDPESTIKKDLKIKKDGPEVPKVVDDEEDLFK